MTRPSSDKIREYVQRLTPQARSRLLVELERLHLAGNDILGSEELLAELRAEFRKGGNAHDRVGNPSRHFYHPLEPILVNSAAERANPGQISRGSLAAIWEWIGHALLPAMTREYDDKMRRVIVASNRHEAERIADAFQLKIVKSLESVLASDDGAERVRHELAMYTSSPAVFEDLGKMLRFLRARHALATFSAALPHDIEDFEGGPLVSVRTLLDVVRSKHPDAVPFALTIAAKHLKAPWQLIRLATKAAASKRAEDIAATPYAISLSMVLDQLDDERLQLSHALKNDQIAIAREILTDIYDVEHALRVRIDHLQDSDWGRRLDAIMKAVATNLDAELHRLPGNLHHVLASPSLHRNDSTAARLTHLIWKCRDAFTNASAWCMGLVGLRHTSAR